MRFSILFIAVFTITWNACGEGIQMSSTSSTNAETGTVRQRDTYTRNGETNLIRNQMTLDDGTIQVQAHRIYHAGQHVVMISEVRDNFSVMTEPGSPYGISIEFHPDRTVRAVALMSTNGGFADMFLETNNVIVPVSTADLQNAQGIGKATIELMKNATNKTTSEFYGEVEDLIEKSQQ